MTDLTRRSEPKPDEEHDDACADGICMRIQAGSVASPPERTRPILMTPPPIPQDMAS